LVNDVIMPPIGMLLGSKDFSSLSYTVRAAVTEGSKIIEPAVVIGYGKFLNNVLDFVIVAFCMFLVVRQMNHVKQLLPSVPTTKTCPECLSTIPIQARRCAHCTSRLEG
jgi:large conductance mechanosensitive channel